MNKKFNYALLGLLAFSLTASAQKTAGDEIEVGNYKYTVNEDLGSKLTGTVTVTEVADLDNFIQNGVLDFPGNIEYTVGKNTYTYKVTNMAEDLYADIATEATTVTIPKELTAIPEGAFNTCTRLNSITFEAGSQVKTIASKAFAGTMITEFDFTPCTKLEELEDNVFIDIDSPTKNINTFITSVTLPTGPQFKHINAAFRNLPELTEIVNFENSFVTEIIAKAFDGDKKLKTISLPGEVKWIDKAALEGSSVESLTVDVTKLLWLGGGSVTKNDAATSMYDKYTFTEGAATSNLYNKTDKTAPLKALILTGTLQGKIATNAFLNCVGLKSVAEEGGVKFDLDQLYFGSQAQIQTDAFKGCENITKLTINDIADNQLTSGQYTIQKQAFNGCKIAELTIGDITTANAIDEEAFGKVLKNVTIGTVKAGGSVFGAKAFIWGNVAGATLNLATGEGEFVSADSPSSANPIIKEGVFDFTAVNAANSPLPIVTIGKILSQGGVFGNKALNGPAIEQLHFIGDINANGIDNTILGEEQDVVTTITYEQADKEYPTVPTGGKELAGTDPKMSLKNVGKFQKVGDIYKKIVGVKAKDEWNEENVPSAEDETEVESREYIYEQADIEYTSLDALMEGREQGFVTSKYDPLSTDETEKTPAANKYQIVGGKYKLITEVNEEDSYINLLKTLTFDGEILRNGVGEGAFVNLVKLQKVTFNGALAEDAVAEGAFIGSGLVTKADDAEIIGSAEKPFVEYNYADVRDYTVNPFNTASFAVEDVERIIYWKVANKDLKDNIAIGIHQNADLEYDGEEVDDKFNVYKWVDILAEEEAALANTFLVFRNQNEPNIAWGRYDLGGFNVEKGKYYTKDENLDGIDDETDVEAYTATNMKIARRQKIDGADVNITLYGLYTESDDNKKQSATYMVPLYSQDGYYYIDAENTELIIVKAEKLDGDFTKSDLPVAYENTQKTEVESWKVDETTGEETKEIVMTETDGELIIADGSEDLEDENGNPLPYNSVWMQLYRAKDYIKSDFTWTHQQLVDEVERNLAAEGDDADLQKKNIAGADLWIMTDPGKYNGFRIDKNEVVKGNGAFIGKNWYYALLKKYTTDTAAEARVIWLDEDMATAIFAVKNFSGAASSNGAVYNLQGIRVNGTQKGVYIQNGKKFIVK